MLAELLESHCESAFAEVAAHRLCWSRYRAGSDNSAVLRKDCESFLKQFPQSPLAGDVQFLLAESLQSAQDFAAAIESYRKVPEKNPTFNSAQYMMAACMEKQGKAREAKDAFDKFAASHPDAPEAAAALLRSISLNMTLGDYAGVEKQSGVYLAKHAQDNHAPEVIFQRAEALRMQGKLDEMSVAFADYIARDNTGREGAAHYWIARASQSAGESLRTQAASAENPADASHAFRQAGEAYTKAIEAYRNARQQGSKFADRAAVHIAECHHANGLALVDAGQALQKQATHAEAAGKQDEAAAHREAAGSVRQQGEAAFAAAADAYNKIISGSPKKLANHTAFVWTAAYFQSTGQFAKSTAVLGKLLETYPDTEYRDRALYQMAALAVSGGEPDWAKCIGYLEQLLQEYDERLKGEPSAETPFMNYALLDLGKAYRSIEKYEKALEPLSRAVARMPDGELLYAEAALQLAHVKYARKELVDARNIFSRIGLLYEDDTITPEALFWAGRTTLEAGNPMGGAGIWALLVRNYGSSSFAHDARRELQRHGMVLDTDGYVKK